MADCMEYFLKSFTFIFSHLALSQACICCFSAHCIHFQLISTVTSNWYNPAHDTGLCEINSYLVQSSKITKAFLFWCLCHHGHLFLSCTCCSNIKFNVIAHAVGFKGFHGISCHLMWLVLRCDHFFWGDFVHTPLCWLTPTWPVSSSPPTPLPPHHHVVHVIYISKYIRYL